MIDRRLYAAHWSALCSRFSRPPDPDEAHDYLTLLDVALDDEGFVRATRHLWATRKFFPTPSDFLTCQAERIWRDLRIEKDRTHRITLATAPLTRAALRYLGGLDAALELARADQLKARAAFLEAYTAAVADLATEHARIGSTRPPSGFLSSGGRESRSRPEALQTVLGRLELPAAAAPLLQQSEKEMPE